MYVSDWVSRWVTERAKHPETEKINYLVNEFFIKYLGGAVAWGTALQAGRSRVPFPMGLFIVLILPAALWPCGRVRLWQKRVSGIFPGEQRRPARTADNIATFLCRLSRNSGSLNRLELYLFINSGTIYELSYSKSFCEIWHLYSGVFDLPSQRHGFTFQMN